MTSLVIRTCTKEKRETVDYYREKARESSQILSHVLYCIRCQDIVSILHDDTFVHTIEDVKYIENGSAFGARHLNCLDV